MPVIATRRGGLPEAIDHKRTGFLVEAEAPGEIATRLVKLIASPGLHARMRSAAQEYVRSTFTQERMIDGVEVLFAAAEQANSYKAIERNL